MTQALTPLSYLDIAPQKPVGDWSETDQQLMDAREAFQKTRTTMISSLRQQQGLPFTDEDMLNIKTETNTAYPATRAVSIREAEARSRLPYDPHLDPGVLDRAWNASLYMAAPPAIVGASWIAKLALWSNPIGWATMYSGGLTTQDIDKWKYETIYHNFQPPPEQQVDPNTGREPLGFRHWTWWAGFAGQTAAIAGTAYLAGAAAAGYGLSSAAAAGLDATATALRVQKFGAWGSALGATLIGHGAVELETEKALQEARDPETGRRLYTDEQAKQRALIVSVATFPFAMAFMRSFAPIAQKFAGKNFGAVAALGLAKNSYVQQAAEVGKALILAGVDGAVNNAISNGLSGTVIRPTQYLFGAQQSLGSTMQAIMGDMATGFVMGGLQGVGIGAVERMFGTPQAAQHIYEQYGVDPDVKSLPDMYWAEITKFSRTHREAADDIQFWDNLIQKTVIDGVYPDKRTAMLGIMARNSEESAASANIVLFARTNDVNGFYSKLREQVEKMPEKGELPAKQILSTLENSGVKADEMLHTQMKAMLLDADKAGASLSKKDLINFIDANATRIKFIVKGTEEEKAAAKAEGQRLFKQMEDAQLEEQKTKEDYIKAINSKKDVDKTKALYGDALRKKTIAEETYHQFLEQDNIGTRHDAVRPLGPSDNYEEWLLQWRLPGKQELQDYKIEGNEQSGFAIVSKNGVIIDAGFKTAEDAQKWVENRVKTSTSQTKFSSDHWAEDNVLVHLRVDRRQHPDGIESLHMIEGQSDWKQQEQVAGSSIEDNAKKIKEYKKKIDAVKERLHQIEEQIASRPEYAEYTDKQLSDVLDNNEEYQRLSSEWSSLNAKLDRAHEGPVEPGPFSKTWTKLAIKKLLIEAVKRGYKRITWSPGYLQDKFQGDPGPAKRAGRAFYYDKRFPQDVIDVLREMGIEDARIGQTEMSSSLKPMEEDPSLYYEGRPAIGQEVKNYDVEQVKIPSLDITKEMEDKIAFGLPLYQTQDTLTTYRLAFPGFEKKGAAGTFYGTTVSRGEMWRTPQNKTRITKQLPLKGDNVVTFLSTEVSGDASGAPLADVVSWTHEVKIDKDVMDFVNSHKFSEGYGSTHVEEFAASISLKRQGKDVIHFVNPENTDEVVSVDLRDHTIEELWSGLKKQVQEDGQKVDTTRWAERKPLKEIKSDTTPPEDITSLFHEAKGMFLLLNSGRMMTMALKNPDASTALHEYLHGVRHFMLRGEDLKAAEAHYGVKDGKWTVEQEEAFVRDALGHLREGQAPNPQLQPLFDHLSSTLKSVYKTVDALGAKVNSELAGIFDRLLVADSDPVKAKRLQLADVEKTLDAEQTKLNTLRGQSQVPEKDAYRAALAQTQLGAQDLRVKELRKQKIGLEKEIRALQEEFTKGETYQEARAKMRQEDYLLDTSHPPENDQKLRGGVSAFFRTVKGTVSQAIDILGDTRTGRRLGYLADIAYARMRTHMGKLEPWRRTVIGVLNEGRYALGLRNRHIEWLREEQNGQTRLQRLIEMRGLVEGNAPTKDELKEAESRGLMQVIDLMRYIQDDQVSINRSMDAIRTLPSGTRAKMMENLYYSFPRLVTPEGRRWFIDKGEEYWAYVDKVVEMNPGMKRKDVDELFSLETKQRLDKSYGFLEMSRKVKNMPESVTIDGKVKYFLHTNPVQIIDTMMRNGYRRLENNRVFGSGKLQNVHMDESVLRQIARATGKQTELKKADFDFLLHENSFSADWIANATNEQKKKALVDAGIDPEIRAGELNEHLLSLTSDQVRGIEGAEAKLRKIAKSVGGIDDKGPLSTLLYDLKQRIQEDIEDTVFNKLRADYVNNEGGRITDFNKVQRIIMGYPLAMMEETAPGRVLKAVSDVLSTMQLSLAAPKNLIQPAALLARTIGTVETIRTYADAMTHFEKAADALSLMGAFHASEVMRLSDSSFSLVRVGKMMSDTAQKWMGHAWTRDLTQVTSGLAGMKYVDKVLEKMTAKDESILRGELKLSDKDIADLKSHNVSKDTYNRIVQKYQAKALIATTAPHRKSLVELNPWASTWFKYISFIFEAQRSINGIINEFRSNIKSGDPVKIAGSISQVIGYTAATMGTGMAMMLLGEGLRRTPPRDDDDWWDMVKGGMFETGVLGVSGQLLGTWNRGFGPQTGSEIMISNAPAMSAVVSLYDAVMGLDRYGDFGPMRRGYEYIKRQTPVLRAFSNQLDAYRYPEHMTYLKARQDFSEWRRSQPEYFDTTGGGSSPLRAEYDDAFQAVSHLDQQWVALAGEQYYKNVVAQKEPIDQALQKLRASLMSRRPIPLGDDKALQYLASLPPEKRKAYWNYNARYEALVDLIAPTLH